MGQLEKVPDSTVLPKCDVVCKIEEFKRTKSTTGKLMYKATFKVIDDGANRIKNMLVFEQYVIGSQKDPDADKQKTWVEAPGARNLKRLLKKLGLDLTQEVDDLITEAEDQEIGLSINRYKEPEKRRVRSEDGTMREVDNEYAGEPRNRITAYWTPGEHEPTIHDEEEEGGDEDEAPKKKKRASTDDEDEAPKKKKVAKDDDEDEEPPKKKKAPVDDDDEDAPPKKKKPVETDDEDEPPAKKKAAAEDDDEDAPKKKEPMLQCPECDEEFPKSKYAKHIAKMHADAD